MRDGRTTVAAVALLMLAEFAATSCGRPPDLPPAPSPIVIVVTATLGPAIAPPPATPNLMTLGVPAAPPPAVPQRLQVVNTDGQGANLRAAAGVSGARLKNIPERSVVEALGPSVEVQGRV